MNNLVYLYRTDVFGCLHNSSHDGGCQYWHGGNGMHQFFCVLTNSKAASYCQGAASCWCYCIHWAVLRTNPIHCRTEIQRYSKSEVPPSKGTVEVPIKSNPLHIIQAFVYWVLCCTYSVSFARKTLVSVHRFQWHVRLNQLVDEALFWLCLPDKWHTALLPAVFHARGATPNRSKTQRDCYYASD